MSLGPLGGIAGSAAGSPLAQTKGAEPERAQQDTVAQQRRRDGETKAEAAAGVGEADGQDHEAHDRDADGRRAWELQTPEAADADDEASTARPQGKDATGESGNLLDLSG